MWLKFENLQFTSSFKERGARNKLLTLTPAEAARGVVAMSAGNHAQGLARHATRLGIPSTIVMPLGTPFTKIEHTERLGARVVVTGASLREAATEAHRLGDEDGLVFVHPFDDVAVIAGQGTVALEMIEAVPGLDALLVPVGGGGLLAGMALGAAALDWSNRLIGVQTVGYSAVADAMHSAVASGTVRTDLATGSPPTIAEGIAVAEPGRLTLPIITSRVEQVVTVEEAHVEDAVALLLDIEKTVVEGAGAAGVAALLAHRDLVAGQRIGIVLTGGNIDTRLLANVLMRRLSRDGRLTALRILLTDRPGRLAAVTSILGQTGANVVELSHHRLASHVAATAAELDVVIETRGRSHTEAVVDALRSAGIDVQLAAPVPRPPEYS